MINYTKLIPWIIIFVLGFLVFDLYHKPTKTIRIPAVVGSITPAPITHLKPTGERLNIVWRDKVIKSENPVNDSLISIYRDSVSKLHDSIRDIRRFQLFVEAVSIRNFESNFEDENLKLTISGKVQGYLKEVSIPEYEIKQREIEVPKKRFHIGPFFGVDTRGQISGGLGVSYSVLSF